MWICENPKFFALHDDDGIGKSDECVFRLLLCCVPQNFTQKG